MSRFKGQAGLAVAVAMSSIFDKTRPPGFGDDASAHWALCATKFVVSET